jgi:hypothetical protein
VKRRNMVEEAAADQRDTHDLLWKQYALYVDLYKSLFDLFIKVNVFYYGITGAIVVYYLEHTAEPLARYGLLLPIAFSITLGGLYIYAGNYVGVLRGELEMLAKELGLRSSPEVHVFRVFLRSLGIISVAIGFVLSVLFLKARGI